LARIAESINVAHAATKTAVAVIENVAGQGNNVGSSLEELKLIVDGVKDKSRVGVCIDTCHAFASGYDQRTTALCDEFWRKFDATLGMSFLR
jgi:deoxyribonuclease-4